MPTYFARGLSVRLSATPLEDSTTQKIILRKGDAAKQQSELAERRLLERKLLKEEVVPFPDDEYAVQLNWVANAPFMQTRVKNDVYDKTEATTGTHLSTSPITLLRSTAVSQMPPHSANRKHLPSTLISPTRPTSLASTIREHPSRSRSSSTGRSPPVYLYPPTMSGPERKVTIRSSGEPGSTSLLSDLG
jgi:hypothetical protein